MKNFFIVIVKSKDAEYAKSIELAFSWLANSYVKLNEGTYIVESEMCAKTLYYKLVKKVIDANNDSIYLFSIDKPEVDDNAHADSMAWWTMSKKKSEWLYGKLGAVVRFGDKELDRDEASGLDDEGEE